MLSSILRPRSIAVIGASRKRGTIGGELFHNVLSHGFQGPVYPVNPTAPVVQSVKAYATLADVPGPVDLAVIVVPARQVLEAIEQCAAKQVKGAVIITAGFGETGPEGKALQNQVAARAREAGIRLIGPNCLGVLNTDPDVNLNATFAPTWPPRGQVGFLSQSGALGLAILECARDLGIGISQFVSIGNKADVSGNDFLEYWEADPGTRVILLYLESFGNPRRFMEIARRVARKKPIVAVKSGRTEAGARAASSHTGSLAGMDVAVDGLLQQAGVIRTDTMEQLFDLALLLDTQPVPRGNRVGILTNAGGPAIMAADACEGYGLRMPPLSAETEKALAAFLPKEASLRNPVDMIASATAQSFEKALKLMLADDNLDAAIVLFVPPIITEAVDVAEAIRRAGEGSAKPIVTCFMGAHGIPAAVASLRDGRFPSYAFPEAAAIALARAVQYGQWLATPPGIVPELADVQPAKARAALGSPGSGGRWLEPVEVRELLEAYGIRMPRMTLARDAASAAAAAEEIGYPVALKLASDTILHKSDVGGVLLGLTDARAVREGFQTLRLRLETLGRLHEMQGAVVQEMAKGGVETFIGVTSDPAFGRLLGFGIGGVNVEVWRDVVFRVHPITDADARQMTRQIRGLKLLQGYRGQPPADVDAIVDALMRVDRMLADLPEVCELDINPLMARPPGEGVVALDARVRIQPSSVTAAASR